jgi:hypothetical protein
MKPHLETIITNTNNILPKLLVIAGTHGNESNAVFTTLNVKAIIKEHPQNFPQYSSITFLIGLNESGLRNNSRATSKEYNKDDLNRIFYEETNYKELVKDAIKDADIILDVHNSPNIVNCVLLNWDEYYKNYLSFFREHQIQTLVWNKNTPTIKSYANSFDGKKGFTVELNNMGICLSQDKENYYFLYEIICQISEIRKIKQKIDVEKDKDDLEITIKPHFEGIFVPFPNVIGKVLGKGRMIGKIIDYNNDVLETIHIPVDGTIVVVAESYYVTPESMLYQISPKGN